MVASSNNDEEYDSFPADAPSLLLDPDSLAIVRDTGRAGGGRGGGGGYGGGGSRTSRSAATTQLASDVGSTVGPRKNPFLKSITFFDPKIYYRGNSQGKKDQGEEEKDVSSEGGDQADDNHCNDQDVDDDVTFEINDLTHWDIMLQDPPIKELQQRKSGIFGKLSKVGDSFKKSKRPLLIVEDFEGLVEFSSVETGDRLVSINKKKIKPEEYSADQAMAYMRHCIANEGVLHVTTKNLQGEYCRTYGSLAK